MKGIKSYKTRCRISTLSTNKEVSVMEESIFADHRDEHAERKAYSCLQSQGVCCGQGASEIFSTYPAAGNHFNNSPIRCHASNHAFLHCYKYSAGLRGLKHIY